MMNPDELLEQLKATANPRKRTNLDIVHGVCREQFERGSKDFSVATIAKFTAERGGPIRQTIHNKTGDDFKGLIAAWASHTGGLSRKPRKVNENPVFAVLEKIENPAVRAVMGFVLAENKKLRGEVNLLKGQTNIVIDQRPAPTLSTSKDTIQILPASAGLTQAEQDALRHAISAGFLADEGWEQDANGRILSGKTKRVIFKVGFVSAIRKVLGE